LYVSVLQAHVLNEGLTSRAPLSMLGRHSLHDHGLRQGVIAPCAAGGMHS